MTAYTHRATIVILASDQANANAEAEASFDPLGGQNTFTVGLSPTGSAPPTHYWCSAMVILSHWQAFVAQEAYQETLGGARTRWLFGGIEGERGYTSPDDALAVLGLKRVQAPVP